MNGLLIVGAGGHGKVVADTAIEIGRWEKIAFLDDKYPLITSTLNWPVLGTIEQASSFIKDYSELTVAIGNNSLRVELLRRFYGMRFVLPSIVHPTAFVSRAAILEAGSVVFAQSAINASSKIGLGSIINTGVTVDHDCILGEGVHLSPGVHLGGEVTIGNYSWLGVGSTVIEQISIGEKVIIGAGSVIVDNLPGNVTVVGVPGRVIKKNDNYK